MLVDPSILADLQSLDDDFEPGSYSNAPQLADLQNGLYELEIVDTKLDRTQNTGDTILRITYKILNGPTNLESVEQVYFLKPDSVKVLASDLVRLNFDANEWKPPQRPFSKELPLVLPKLKGVMLKAEKKESKPRQSDGKVYHNLNIKSRINKVSAPGSFPSNPRPTPLTGFAAPQEGEEAPF